MPHSRNLAVDCAISETLAVVLAGGRGERLKFLTENESKPALPFAGRYRLIDFPLSNCVNSGIRKISVVTQYCSHTLIHHVQRTWGFLRRELNEFVEVWPAQQQTPECAWYAGTADAMHQNLRLIRSHRPRYVLILAGDHAYKQDYRQLLGEHLASGVDVTVSCVDVPYDDAHRFGIVTTDVNEHVTGFVEKPKNLMNGARAGRCLASMGIYLFNADVLAEVLAQDSMRTDSTHDFGRDILPALLGRYRVLAHRFRNSCVAGSAISNNYWRDVGTVDAYWDASMDLVRAEPLIDLYDRAWPIWTGPEQYPPSRIVDDENYGRGMVVNSMVGAGALITGARVRRSVLFAGAIVGAGSVVEDSVVMPDCVINTGAHIGRAILAEGCHVPDGLVIGEEPEQDAARFHVSAGGITVVTPQMLANLRPSVMVPPKRPRKVAALNEARRSEPVLIAS